MKLKNYIRIYLYDPHTNTPTFEKAKKYVKEMSEILVNEKIEYQIFLMNTDSPLKSYLIEIDNDSLAKRFKEKFPRKRLLYLSYFIDLNKYRPCDCSSGYTIGMTDNCTILNPNTI